MTENDTLLCCAPISTPDLSDDDAEELAIVLKALADPVRLRVLSLVVNSGEVCACDLPAILGKSQPTVSHHLSNLVKAGILEREQRGKWAWFHLCEDQLNRVRQALG